MNSIRTLTGNIFASRCQTLVNTVNCSGVMGAGLALECRLRWPLMFEKYAQLCDSKMLDIGSLWLYRGDDRWLLNFPTKKDWRLPSREAYLRRGLEKFMQTYREKGITSVAFPLLGAQHGGMDANQVLELMHSYLHACTIPVEIYRYDAKAADDLYARFKAQLEATDDDAIKHATGLQTHRIALLRQAVTSPRICQLNQLAACRGIGDKTLERAFAMTRMPALPSQHKLL